MPIQFGDVKPGIALGPDEAEKLKKEIEALLTGMAASGVKVGNYCNIRDFKLRDGRILQVRAQVTAVNGNTYTVNLT